MQVHPHDAKQWTDETGRQLEELASHSRCVAIGECGLDFNRNFSTPEKQQHAFEEQVPGLNAHAVEMGWLSAAAIVQQSVLLAQEGHSAHSQKTARAAYALSHVQIKLACRLHKPLFMHCRDAADTLAEILRCGHGLPCVPALVALSAACSFSRICCMCAALAMLD